jgi:cytochrome b6-f complex iron-sulfur subunit
MVSGKGYGADAAFLTPKRRSELNQDGVEVEMQAKAQEIETVDAPRRKLLNRIWIGLGIVALAEVVWMVFSFFRPSAYKSVSNQQETLLAAGALSSFSKGSVTAFSKGRFYLACLPDGGFMALSLTCTHLGCTIPWDAQKLQFICPCHASVFDITGSVIQSPAQRPLDIYRVRIENEIVLVDLSHKIKRRRFEKSQVAYAA